MFLLAFGTAAAAPTPFVCSNNFYIVQGSAASVTLNTVNIGTKTLTPIGSASSTLYNGIGFRPQDGFIWGSDGGTANKIVQVDATGTLNVLTLSGGITLSNSGDVNPVTGLYYNGGGGGTTLYEINVAAAPNPALVRTLTLSQKIGFDMAFSPLSGNAFTVYQGQLYSFAIPASGTAVTVNGPMLTTGVTMPVGDTYGAAFFDQNGIFYPYDNKGTLYRINLNTSPATVSIAASGLPNVANNDGAWCAAAPNMTKDATPRAIVPGGTTTYTFTINNILAATNVAFTDTLPAGLTFVPGTVNPATVAGGTPVLSGGNATLTIPNMTLAGTTNYTFTIQAQAAISANGDYPNQANLTGTIYGGNAQVSAVSSDPTLLAPYQPTVVSVAVPSLGLAKTSNGPWTVGQAGATFTLTVTNSGTAATAGTITVLDTLPTGISAVSGTYSGWACTVAGQSVTCTSATSIAATNGTSAIALPVTVAAAAAGSVTNDASVGGGGDPNNGGSAPAPASCLGGDPHCASTTTTVNLPQLTVTKSATPIAFAVGGSGTYSLTVGNAGTASTAGNITITDALPSGITTTATPSGGGWNCSASTPTNVSCTTAAVLAVGGSAPVISVPVAIAVGTASPAVNTAAATGGGDTTCPGSAHCFDQISTTVNAPSLGIAKTANGPWTAGQSGAQYTLTATNTGPVATTGTITVLDTMPTGVTPSQASPFTSGSWTCNFASPTLTCTSAASIVATSGTSTLFVPVDVTAAAIPNVTNQASVGGGGDPNNGGAPPTPGSCAGADSHCGSATTTVNAPSAPTIAKAFGAASIPLNGSTSLSFTVTNPNAATTLTGVGVTDTLPAGLVVSTPNGLTGSCGGGTITATAGSGGVSLSGATLAASASCTFSVNVTGTAAGAQNNTTGNVTATESGNGGTASASTTVVAPPTISKSFSPASIVVNGTTTLTLTITNSNTTQSLSGVAFNDVFPGGMTVAAPATTTNTCTGTLTATAGAGSISLSGGTLAAGAACTITVVVTDSTIGAANNTTNAISSTEGGTGTTSNTATLTVNGQPSLGVTKSSNGPWIVGQGGSTYTLTVTNTGSAATSGTLTVLDTLPNGITAAATFTSGSWSCTTSGQGVTCTSTTSLAATNGTSTITIPVTVGASAVGTATNIASVGGGGDPNNGGGPPTPGSCAAGDPHCGSTGTNVAPAADIAVVKTVDNATPSVGQNVTFTITATNNGPNDATGVQVTDSLPAGLSYVSSNPSQGTYTQTSGVWNIGALTNGANATLTITATVTLAGAITNTATVTASDQTDPNTSNNSSSSSLNPAAPMADIAVYKTVDNATPSVLSNINYTIAVTNDGPDAATNVAVTDLLPAGLTFVSATPAQGAYNSGTGVWAVGNLANGASTTLTITATVNAAGTIVNTATKTAEDQADPNSSNNSSGVTINDSGNTADIQVVKSVDNTAPNLGQNVTFTISTRNNGPDAATNVAVTDLLPAGLTFVSATPLQGTYTSGTGVWTIGALAANATTTLTIVATVATPGALVNTATKSGEDQVDPNASNDSSSVSLSATSADIAVNKTVSNAAPNVGDTITYTISTRNNGPDAATNVAITDLLPAGLTFVSATPLQGSYNSITGVWTIGALAANATTTLTIQALVVSSSATTNTATKTGEDQFDSNTGNDSSSATITPQQADLQVGKTVDNATPYVGNNVTFTVTVSDLGPDPATNVTVADLLPAGLTYVSSTPAQGSYNSITGVWTIGALAANATTTLTIVATVTASGNITNTASLSHSDQYDPDTTNNSGTATLNAAASADLSITNIDNVGGSSIVPAIGTVAPGGSITYTIVATNNGPSDVTGGTVADTLPAVLTNVTWSCVGAGGGTCTGSGNGNIADTVNIPAGGNVTYTVSATVSASATGTLSNTATVSSGVADPNPGNNSATDTDNISATLAPSVAKAFSPASIVANGTTTLTFTLTNPNVSAALAGLAFTDAMPAGMTVATGLPGNSCGGSLTATVGSGSISLSGGALVAGGSCTIGVNVTDSVAGTAVNTTGAVGSTNGGTGNTATATLTVNGQPSLGVTKTSNGPWTANQSSPQPVYTLTVTNTGATATSGTITVDDTLPTGITATSFTSAPWTCTVTGQNVSCTSSAVLAATNGTSAITMPVTVGSAAVGNVTNNASVGGGGDPNNGGGPPTPGSCTAGDPHCGSTSTTVGAPNLTIQKSGPANITAGNNITYMIVVNNSGSAAATNAMLTDPTPAGLTLVSATAPCTSGFPCNLGTLNAPASATVSVTYTVDAAATGTITNTATVTSDQTAQTSSSASTVVGAAAQPVPTPALDPRGLLLLTLTLLAGGTYRQRRRRATVRR